MEKTRKISVQTMIIIALSVLLAISIIVGGTLAYFSANDEATGTITLGDAIGIDILNGSASAEETFTITADKVIPSQKISPNVNVKVSKSSTNSVLRMKIEVTAEGGTGTGQSTVQETFLEKAQDLLKTNHWKSSGEKGYFYYVDSETETNVKEVDSSSADVTVNMLSGEAGIVVPETWTQEQVAGANVKIKVTVQAVQIAYKTGGTEKMTTVTDYETVFETVFPTPGA